MKGDNTEDSQTKSIDTDQLIDRLDELGNVAEELEDINHAIRDLTDRVERVEDEAGIDHQQRARRELAKETANSIGEQLLPSEPDEPPTISIRYTLYSSDFTLIGRDWDTFELEGVESEPDIHLKLTQPRTDDE